MNALCREACFDDKAGRDRSRPIAEHAVLEAQERLILARVTHLDNLADKLREERVRRVVEPILSGAEETACSEDDLAYVRDLGLVAHADGGAPRIANPIYAEVVPRHLSYVVQETLPQRMWWYVDADGALDVEGLIEAFQAFFREHSEHWVQRSSGTMRLGRSCCCRRTCSGSLAAAGGSSGSTRWGAGARTC